MRKAPGDRLSCTACAASKRKCGKQQPRCQRCCSRGIACRYPQPKPGTFVPLSTISIRSNSPSNPSKSSQLPLTNSGIPASPAPPLFSLSIDPSSDGIADDQSTPWWFASPETWVIDYAPGGIKRLPPSPDELNLALGTVYRWLRQWVDGDSSPFIHHGLYRQRFPQSMQDAYMALLCYLNRKPSNEQAIFKIIEDKAQRLVEQGKSSQAGTRSAELDPLEHLARAQALLIYQLTSLYDGNIRLRYIAEKHIPILCDWMHKAIDSARSFQYLGAFLLSPSNEGGQFDNLPWEQSAWYSWILAESLRRTWLVVSLVQGVYLASQDGVSKCLGGMMFTSRQGFWDAPSAFAWQKRCSEIYGGLVRLTETDKLFSMLSPDDLDEFTKLVLEVTFGSNQLERWGVRRTISPT